MPSAARPFDWDIFCTVIDNFGDIGVCWRLARQLHAEQGVPVRLWVDELAAFEKICPQVDPLLPIQNVGGIEIRHWTADFQPVHPGAVVIEAFACQLPPAFIAAMAECEPPPVWINLDYLSAESWVADCHTLPSPHPRLPLTKFFFFPGFDATTGGLLRETDLEARRQAYCASPRQQAGFWGRLGQSPPPADALLVSLFAYENPALAGLLALWARGPTPVCCLAPLTRTGPAIEAFAQCPGQSLQAGEIIRRGHLEIRLLPFVTQTDYDQLLWTCDVNLVRGEDSFVRAQWAARPMLWQIYPQHDEAHLIKLEAFLDRYCAALPAAAGETLRELHHAWNAGNGTEGDEVPNVLISDELWARWLAALPELRHHAERWANNLSKYEDLCTSLYRFARSKL